MGVTPADDAPATPGSPPGLTERNAPSDPREKPAASRPVASGRHPRRTMERARLLGVICLGGAIGTYVRALLEDAAPTARGAFPWTTLGINVIGAFALGLLLEVLVRTGYDTGWRRTARLGLGTGVLGGFTTYSTFAVEVVERLTPDSAFVAVGYAVSSVTLGVAAAALGHELARRLSGARQRIEAPR